MTDDNQEILFPPVFIEGVDFDPHTYDFSLAATRLDPYSDFNQRDVIAAMIVTGANFAHMAVLLGRSRAKVFSYVYRNPPMVEVLRDVQESLLDYMEQGLRLSALAGDSADRRYVLSTMGKERGYSSRSEMTGPNGGPVSVASVVDASALTPEQRQALKVALLAAKDSNGENE